MSGQDGVTPADRRYLGALASAAIDPGERTFHEVVVRMRPTPLQGVVEVTNDLEARGLVVSDGVSVRLTDEGAALVNRLGLPWAVRT